MNQGWANQDGGNPVRRQDVMPQTFQEETKPGDPACAAWDEPGYEDPDRPHRDLPLGTRYYQGTVKRATGRTTGEERAMSPGWVTRVTQAGGRDTTPAFEKGEPDPLWDHVTREKETERFSSEMARFYPG